jgi:UDP-2-acetamido-3-amino-2,3-dideoxy-glucuronate N-acetyltransferase
MSTSPWSADATAIVEPGAFVGEGTRIWHHAHVRAGAVIGARCSLGKGVFVDDGAVVGNDVKIQNNVSVYRGVRLGNEVFVGPSAVFTNDLRPRATGAWELATTEVGDGASIGANATIVCGVTIGPAALVGAGAVVTRDVAAHQLVVGNPARPSGWVCHCGAVVAKSSEPPADLTCGDCQRP